MDQLSANETGGNRKSLVISRLELFEQINSTNDARTTNRPSVVNKPVSRSSSNISDVDDRDRGRPDVNNSVNINNDNDSSDDGIDVNAAANGDDVNANRSAVTEEADEYFKNQDLLPDLKNLQIRNDLSPCSKRISYNIAVSRGAEFSNIAINRHKDKPKCDNTIDESENEEAVVAATEIPLNQATADAIDESDSEESGVKVEKIDAEDNTENTGANDSTTILVSRTDSDASSSTENLSRCVPVDDINIEDLNSTKLTNDILSVISSSRITDECKFDETYSTNASCPNDETSPESDDVDVDYPEELNPFGDDDETEDKVDRSRESKISNPFDSDDNETDLSTSKSSTKVSTNPFWSGSEEEDKPSLDDLSVKKTPVPLPRSVIKPVVSITPQPSPKPRVKSTINEECGSPNTANVPPSSSPSRRSLQMPTAGGRKLSGDSLNVSFLRSPGSQSGNSTLRKKKPPPPPPPVAAKSPSNNNNINTNGVQSKEQTNQTNAVPAKPVISPWKNKKGPAPARPIPIRRPVKEMPLEDIKTELSDIEVRQQELERQSKHLEQMIRDQNVANSDNAENSSSNEELVLQLFELVNEKNELFRRHSELMYMRKMHNLEKEQADIEYQLRCLMLQPESNKTDCDKSQEDELLRRLVELVEKRNEIVEAMEKDRLRETAEDKSVTTQLDVNECNKEEKTPSKKSKKKKDKLKERKEDGDNKHSPSKVIKQKFMTLRHSTKKLNSKIPH